MHMDDSPAACEYRSVRRVIVRNTERNGRIPAIVRAAEIIGQAIVSSALIAREVSEPRTTSRPHPAILSQIEEATRRYSHE